MSFFAGETVLVVSSGFMVGFLGFPRRIRGVRGFLDVFQGQCCPGFSFYSLDHQRIISDYQLIKCQGRKLKC